MEIHITPGPLLWPWVTFSWGYFLPEYFFAGATLVETTFGGDVFSRAVKICLTLRRND